MKVDQNLKGATPQQITPYGSIKEWYSPINTPVGTPGASNKQPTLSAGMNLDKNPDYEPMERGSSPRDSEQPTDGRSSNVSYELQRQVSADQEDDTADETDDQGDSGESTEAHSPSTEKDQPFSKRQIFTIAVLSFAGVCSSMFGSLLAPFFPTEAIHKGVSETWVGLIFGSYQLITFILSPVWGAYLTKIGAKFMYVAGIFVNSSCAILFGFLQWCPPGHIYLVMCLATRSVEAAAAAAIGTSSKALATHTFPTRISTVMGILNACGCVGLMIGPPIGGLLYELGGFYLPFMVTGAGFMMCAVLSWFFLPAPPAEEEEQNTQNPIPKWHLLKHPVVSVIGSITFVGAFAMGYLDVVFALHLKDVEPSLSQAYIGLIYLIAPVVVVIFAPIIGWVADKLQSLARIFMILGIALAGLGFMGLGPSPFLPFLPTYSLGVVLPSLAISGVGWAALVITYQEFVTAAKVTGFPDNLETQGLVSGVYNSYNSLGAFFGPVLGGLMNEKIHFPWAITVNAFMIFLVGLILLVYMLLEAFLFPNRYKDRPEASCSIEEQEDRDRLIESSQPLIGGQADE